MGCPIRKFPDQSLFAAPRNLSQRTTSFIASQRQGIHRTPLVHSITLIASARSSRSLTAHPFVRNLHVAEELYDDLAYANRDYLPERLLR